VRRQRKEDGDMNNINLNEMLQQLADKETADWPQVGRLDADDMRKRKNMDRDVEQAQDEARILLKKLEALRAKFGVESAEWWAYLKKKYSLPTMREFSLRSSGEIMMKPKEKGEKK
jgi:hypothetical protein